MRFGWNWKIENRKKKKSDKSFISILPTDCSDCGQIPREIFNKVIAGAGLSRDSSFLPYANLHNRGINPLLQIGGRATAT
jgi:hypothetical protein